MTNRKWFALLLLLAMASGPAMAVSVDYDRENDFSKYKTFAWREGRAARSEMNEKRIRDAVNANLEAAGLVRTEGEADVYVLSYVSVEGEERVNVEQIGYGGYWGGGYGSSVSTSVSSYTEGTLVIDIWDAKKEQMVWRGIATATVGSNAGKNEKKLDNALEKMSKQYQKQQKQNAKALAKG